MSNSPRLSDIDILVKSLKKSRRELHALADALPDEDAYATPYSILIDGINHITELIVDLKASIKDAKEYRKQNPHQFPNRAKGWCAVYKVKDK